MEHLNVQQFRDRTASYYRLMNVDKAACRGESEKAMFSRIVKRNFAESMDIRCPRAKEYDRKRFDRILERMESYLVGTFEDFEKIGLCA